MLVALVIFCCGNDATKVEIRSAMKKLAVPVPHLLGQPPTAVSRSICRLIGYKPDDPSCTADWRQRIR